MKNIILILNTALVFTSLNGCLNKGSSQNENNQTDTSTVADTGYTGIKQYYSKSTLSYEVTFKNGVRQGLMKTYYADGKLRQTFWYENGVREDTAVWYYEDGKVFRKTAFRRDSMNGLQIQYYKSGKVRAKLEFVDGLRKPYLEEFTSDGKKVTDYPELIVKTKDDYNTNGTYTISLSLSKPNVKAAYYRGDYIDGLFAPKKLVKVNTTDNTGSIKLSKSGTPGQSYVGIIAEINTPLGNKLLVYKRVDLPYKDLK